MSEDKHVTIHLTPHGRSCAESAFADLQAVAGCDIALSPFVEIPFLVVYSRCCEVVNKLERYFGAHRVETTW